MEQGINSKLFWDNDSILDTISICPISAITGEGISDLLKILINQNYKYENELKCIIMEKSIIDGMGTSIDVILINGELKKGDNISITTDDGIINTTIRNLLTTPPNRESRIKSEYINHESLKGSISIKIIAPNLEKAIVGSEINFQNNNSSLQILTNIESNIEIITENFFLQNNLESEITVELYKFNLQKQGVTVYASTQGSLEALINFFENECNPPIPVAQVYIGTILKKHINKIIINKTSKKEFSTILAFNVNIDEETERFAIDNEIKIFKTEIIYHLFDQFIEYKNNIIKQRKNFYRPMVVFPCILKILEKNIFNKKNPIIFGVKILEGSLHINTQLIIPELNLNIGNIIGIQHNSKDVLIGMSGTDVCIKVENDLNITYGRQFNHKNVLVSNISRTSIDILKEHFRDEINKEDANTLIKIKKLLNIV